VNVTVLLDPFDAVATAIFLAPVVAALVMFRVAVAEVELTTWNVPVATLTPTPSPVSPVAPVRLLPVRVTGTLMLPLAGCVAVVGLIEVNVGPTTANVTALLVPPGVLTVMLWGPSAVVDPRLSVACTVVSFTAAKFVTLILGEPGAFTLVAPVRPVPVRVTLTLVPRKPCVGAIEVSVGPSAVNITAGLFGLLPAAVVTVTFLACSPALAVMVHVALTVVEVDAVTVQLTPLPDVVTVCASSRLVPVRVTATLVPRNPDAGAMEASVGALATAAPWNSTAPMSKACGLEGSGLGLPKKSVDGCFAELGT
jgi:hypothetical protein